jgi:Ser/Thr protein kinase RdoA (MazF antagonist)
MPALIATEAQAAWGCTGAPELLSHRENAVFAVHHPEVGRAALRVHRPGYKSAAGIAAELELCTGLAEAGIPCPRGIETTAGGLVWHGPNATLASLVSWVDGIPIGAGDQPLADDAPRTYRALGTTLARMHRAAADLPMRDPTARPAWDLDGLTGPDPIWGRYWETGALAAPDVALILAARDVARTELARRDAELSTGMIHADPLRENVLATPGGLALIDFDDCGQGYLAYDIAVALTQSLDEPALPDLRDALVAGYRDASALTDADLAVLPLLSMLRSFCALAWVAPRYPAGHPKGATYATRALRAARAVLEGEDFLSVRR